MEEIKEKKKLKDSWNREEVRALCIKCSKDWFNEWQDDGCLNYDKWMEDNL